MCHTHWMNPWLMRAYKTVPTRDYLVSCLVKSIHQCIRVSPPLRFSPREAHGAPDGFLCVLWPCCGGGGSPGSCSICLGEDLVFGSSLSKYLPDMPASLAFCEVVSLSWFVLITWFAETWLYTTSYWASPLVSEPLVRIQEEIVPSNIPQQLPWKPLKPWASGQLQWFSGHTVLCGTQHLAQCSCS